MYINNKRITKQNHNNNNTVIPKKKKKNDYSKTSPCQTVCKTESSIKRKIILVRIPSNFHSLHNGTLSITERFVGPEISDMRVALSVHGKKSIAFKKTGALHVDYCMGNV